MPDHDKERWKILCEQASQEQDPKRLMELVKEINTLLAEDSSKDAPDSPRKIPKTADAA